jgi:hypothetical protein
MSATIRVKVDSFPLSTPILCGIFKKTLRKMVAQTDITTIWHS